MLSKTIVKHPVTTLIAFILIVALGLYTATNLAIDLYPDIKFPALAVSVTYKGVGPEEIEKTITKPLENVIGTVGNIDKITSTSSEGSTLILISFTYGTDISEAANDVRDKIELIKKYLPEGSESPMILKADLSMLPIMSYIVTGNRSPEELRKISEDIIKPKLEQIQGVASASVSGGRERAILVEIPQNRLEAYNLTLSQISSMLGGQNIQISAGNITEGNKEYLVQTSGEYTDIEQIKNTVVAYKGGAPDPANPRKETSSAAVRLRDIANVYDGLKKEENAVYINGKPAIHIDISKQTGKNSVKIADLVKERVKKINEEVPIGIKVDLVSDNTQIIKNSINSVTRQILEGGIFSILILFLFLRNLKGVIIMSVSLPISVIITLMLMYFFHQTLNIMTLAGLALGIGKLVDDSIIIFEKIYSYREKGTKHESAAIIGTQEMMMAVTASTFTSICVYAPIIMFKDQLGMIGEMFIGLAFTVVISLAASLVVALFLVPVLSSRYLPISTRLEQPLTGLPKLVDDTLEGFWRSTSDLYRRILAKILRHRLVTVVTIIIILVFSFCLIPFVGLEFMPQASEDSVTVSIEMPVGTKLEVTKNMVSQIEDVIKKDVRGIKDIMTSAGEKGFYGMGALETNKGTITVTLPEFSQRIDDSTTIKQKLRKHFNDFPSASITFAKNDFSSGSSSTPIDILVKSENLDKAKATAMKIRDILKTGFPEVTEPVIDMKDGLPQIDIRVDRDKAYSLGLNIYTIGNELKANIDGITASKFKESGSEYDILVSLDPKDKQSVPDLERVFVMTQTGKKIPLSNIASIVKTTGPVSINRENQSRTIHVTGGLAPKANLNIVEPKVRSAIKREIPMDEEVRIEYSGDFAELMKYMLKFILILIVAFALVFGIMAAQFESFIDPFIIIFTVPLTLIGVIGIHFAFGEKFSIYTAVGMVVLLGIVVNNGIVLVDYMNLLRSRNYGIIDACIEAGGNRLRPVLMTTMTVVLGLIPMAFFKGEGTDLSQPLAKTILGGLIASTFFTLFLIPVIYSLFNQMSDKRKVRKEAKRMERLEYRRRKLAGEIVD
jgi:hydrophobic/amphiphilic exporter-1 (mainly G- bacteria), HAE1 family